VDSQVRALIVVVLAGSAIMAVGTTTLIVIFRTYGQAKAGSRSHKKLIAALVAFIFLCCLGLFALSYLGL
jgi:hypothetical protein